MKILYGISSIESIDVTNICFPDITTNNFFIIPGDKNKRINIFGEPEFGSNNKIIIINNNITTEYDDNVELKINIKNNIIQDISHINIDINEKIKNIHSKLRINYGSLYEELCEQKMVARYFTGKEKVLELGGNIGRNSLLIASLLDDSNNLVTLESDVNIAQQLIENRELNNLHFHIENAALSNRKLIQKGWNTMPSDILHDGFSWVNTITFDNLKNKYNIIFDTLVLDCEGAFYYILTDMPEILNNINLIVMENDYGNILHKNYIDNILMINNFYVDYVESGGWGPCKNNFYEVWKKM